MKARVKHVLIQLLLLPLVIGVAFAQTGTAEPPGRAYTQAELDQMLAPIALYPDPLLSQILMASTYPLEVVEAARWARDNPTLEGDGAVRAVEDRDWDPSVKSLVAFPRLLIMMDTKLDWTERLGDAFLAQQADVTNTIQSLRRRAYEAGNLQSSGREQVEEEDGMITIEPSDPDVVYVPYYDPTVVYGVWWWPAYPPVYWAPWPGYYVSPGFVGLTWGVGIVVGTDFFFGVWDWHRHDIRIVNTRPFYYHRADRRPLPPERVWRHNPEHRRGVPYRSRTVRERFRRTVGSPARRREFRGFVPRVPQDRTIERRVIPPPSRGSTAHPPQPRRAAPRAGRSERLRPNTPAVRQLPRQPEIRQPTIRRVPSQRPNAFEGLGRGRDVRRYSERGRRSVQRAPAIRRIVPGPALRGHVGSPAGGERGRERSGGNEQRRRR